MRFQRWHGLATAIARSSREAFKYAGLMKTRLAVLAAAILFAPAACLAGGPSKAGSYASPSYDWAGFYVGVHGGHGEADIDISRGSGSQPGTPGSTLDADGGLYGVLAGVNFQHDRFVFGVEADVSFGELEGTNPVFTLPSLQIDSIGTVRGRLGLAFNRLLIFGTAGVGFVDVDASERGGPTNDSADQTEFVGGGGVEFAVSRNLIVRAEYLRGDFDAERYAFPLSVPHTHDIEFDADVVRGAVLWKFGGHRTIASMK